jgi:hypothetical protein
MQTAIVEVRAFTQKMIAEKEKADQKAKAESWTKYAALSMAFIALIAGYTMTKSGSCAGRVTKDLSEATYNQTQASDQWSFFQSKGQKQMLLELELNLRQVAKDTDQAGQAKLTANISRYTKEKADITIKAEGFEKARDGFRNDAAVQAALGAKYGLAAQTFQIALAIGGLCLLSKKKWMWFITLGVAVLALVRLGLILV